MAPSLRSGHPYAVRNDDVVVTVRPDGTVFAAWSFVPAGMLGEKLAWLREHNPRSRLVIRADRSATFAMVRNAVRAAGDAGWRRVTIECQPPMLLLERRIRAGLALPQRDDSKLVDVNPTGTEFSMERLWY